LLISVASSPSMIDVLSSVASLREVLKDWSAVKSLLSMMLM